MLEGITLGIVSVGIILALWFCWRNYEHGKSLPSGNDDMKFLGRKIREGADTFLLREFKVSVWVVLAITVLFSWLFHIYVGASYLLGAMMSALSALIGMKGATLYNTKVACAARDAVAEGKPYEEAMGISGKIAIRGGSIMGFAVNALVLLGFLIILLVFGRFMGYADLANLVPRTSVAGIDYVMLLQILTGYALGCSTIAVFNRLGGGIFTKGADMAADLVGKTKLGIPEDHPKNPAVIADCVGDNVGDVAGNGSDLYESTAGAVASAMALAVSIAVSFRC